MLEDLREGIVTRLRSDLLDWLCIWAVVVLFTYFFIDFGGIEHPFYRIALSLVCASILVIFLSAVHYFFRMVSQLSFATKAALAALVVAAFFGPYLEHLLYADAENALYGAAHAFFTVFAVSMASYFYFWALKRSRSASLSGHPDAMADEHFDLQSCPNLLHVKRQLSGVNIQTKEGAELNDIPFVTLLRVLESCQGLRVHRDHWVSDHAVLGFGSNRSGQIVLALKNGDFVPVSETYQSRVRSRFPELDVDEHWQPETPT